MYLVEASVKKFLLEVAVQWTVSKQEHMLLQGGGIGLGGAHKIRVAQHWTKANRFADVGV